MEYLEKHLGGHRNTQFCEYYRQWLAKHRLTMRQEHQAGEKLFVDYSGNKPHLMDPTTGERTAGRYLGTRKDKSPSSGMEP